MNQKIIMDVFFFCFDYEQNKRLTFRELNDVKDTDHLCVLYIVFTPVWMQKEERKREGKEQSRRKVN